MKAVFILIALLSLILPAVAIAQTAPEGMTLIPEGEFWMGRHFIQSADDYLILERDRRDDQPAHKVYVDAFYMDKYEVTQAEYSRFIEATGAAKPWYWQEGKLVEGQQKFPIHHVMWEEAAAYCRWTGKRLPTEAEWERAARGGLDRKRNPWGDDGGRGRVAAPPQRQLGPVEVGSVPAQNAYGLFDIIGNVWEWTSDWYDRDYYASSPYHNPQGPPDGNYRVIRGSQVHFRNYSDPDYRTSIIGFRCVQNVK
jgi:formylglycine-generating enzyme required for sulfatase activity